LTGSGPTLYFLSDTNEQAEDIAKGLSDLGHFTISTQTDQVGARLD
jgi:4-diphosphocytidyl-2C-methyl-D-erythritol kinase